MRISTFTLTDPDEVPDIQASGTATYSAPTLSAYAIENAHLWTYGDMDGVAPTHFLLGSGFLIEGDKVIWEQYRAPAFGVPRPITLLIYYHGIRDHRLLFPSIKNEEIKQALSAYYREADVAFESGCWLSFIVMCGAIFEGILRTRLGDFRNGMYKLIKESRRKEILDDSKAHICQTVRQYRNSIHSSEFSKTGDLRSAAMDARVVLDYIVREVGASV